MFGAPGSASEFAPLGVVSLRGVVSFKFSVLRYCAQARPNSSERPQPTRRGKQQFEKQRFKL